ncbi:hypothetical protein QKU48_gp0818 [Fadolivirus algeromassiliense]|jgi:hypothetical protein|uniref:Uncharacterized protein n=1 Tax=Fadolivirus FV1/VV64 TaxID=3070911 RepID=A0A7D3V7Q5_9VIRU|nr:hypothetical protein QKU48_gp0818 [Fadolivirus algeromassiliense]QKF94276.1 hypothetical protein Fadolivirus_1_818 [Fadolivirus FV1/VV64]
METSKLKLDALLEILRLQQESPALEIYIPNFSGMNLDEKLARLTNFIDIPHNIKKNNLWDTNFLIFPMDLFARIKGLHYLEKFYNVPMYIRGFKQGGSISLRQMINILHDQQNITASFFANTFVKCVPETIIVDADNKYISCQKLIEESTIIPKKFNEDIYSAIVFTMQIKQNNVDYIAFSRINKDFAAKISLTQFIHDGYTQKYIMV